MFDSKTLAFLWVAPVLFLACSCNRRHAPTEIDVSGVILKADGSGFSGLHVTFWPTTNADKFQTLPSGMTDQQGKFNLRMRDPSKPGIPVAVYKVTLMPLPGTDGGAVPKQYREFESTPWEAKVEGDPAISLTYRIGQ